MAPDGATLFVALGGLNAVAVVDAADGAIRGLIPTAWYPNQLALNADGTQLADRDAARRRLRAPS